MSALVPVALALAAACPELPPPPRERGVALGLFSMDPAFRYAGLVDEVAALGASHLSVVWVWWQADLRSTEIRPVDGWTATEAQVLEAMAAGRSRGLHVTLFPIVRLVKPADGAWRGRIAPADEDRWWASYDAFVLRAGALAAHARAERLSIGSELLTREPMRARWSRLVDRLRLRHPRLELMYSANWDHFRPVRFWDLVDVVGLTAYWEVGRGRSRRVEALRAAWRAPLADVGRFARALGRPVVFTEIGYPSQEGALAFPWDETRSRPVDLEEQRIGFEAFARAVGDAAFVQGAYVWNWFGFGGPADGDYTPRGKPAAALLGCWYAGGEGARSASTRTATAPWSAAAGRAAD